MRSLELLPVMPHGRMDAAHCVPTEPHGDALPCGATALAAIPWLPPALSCCIWCCALYTVLSCAPPDARGLTPAICEDGRTDPLAFRNRAMLLLGFAVALRRSELVGLQLGNALLIPGRGVRLLVRRSKTNQQGRAQERSCRPSTLVDLTRG